MAQNDGSIDRETLTALAGMQATKVDYYIHILEDAEYLNLSRSIWDDSWLSTLTQKGRKFSIENDLI
jgi:hypothetical protein